MIPRMFRVVMIGWFCLVAPYGLGIAQQQQVVFGIQQNDPKELELLLQREVRFLRHVVKLTPDQDAQLSNMNVEKLEDNRNLKRKVAPGVDFAGGNVRIVQPGAVDPLRRRLVERAFEKEIASLLTAEQSTTYEKEKKLRDSFYKDTAIRGVLVILDKRLCLSEDQREDLYKRLEDWGGIVSFNMTLYESSNSYTPNIPDSVLVDSLNENQRAILNGLTRVDFGNRMDFDINLQLDLTR